MVGNPFPQMWTWASIISMGPLLIWYWGINQRDPAFDGNDPSRSLCTSRLLGHSIGRLITGMFLRQAQDERNEKPVPPVVSQLSSVVGLSPFVVRLSNHIVDWVHG